MKCLRESSPRSILPSRCSQLPVRSGEVSACSSSSRIDVQALLGRHQRAPVALDVADRDQPLDDRRARRRRADPRVLHRLAQLVVVDELAGRLHRAEQRGVAVAARRFGFLARALDLARLHLLVLAPAAAAAGRRPRPPRPLGLGVGWPPRRRRRASRARAAACRGCGTRGPPSPLAAVDGRLHARVLEHRLGMEDGQEAPHDHVVDAAVVGVHLLELVLGAGGDDRVVVGDLLVVDDARERQHVEAGHVLGALARTRGCVPTSSAIGLISSTMSVVR